MKLALRLSESVTQDKNCNISNVGHNHRGYRSNLSHTMYLMNAYGESAGSKMYELLVAIVNFAKKKNNIECHKHIDAHTHIRLHHMNSIPVPCWQWS